MADFRKSLLLAAMTLAIGVGTASAQTPTCTATLGNPPQLRSEGQTELTGAIVLVCSDLPASSVNFDVTLNNGTVPITSRGTELAVTVTPAGSTTGTVYPGSLISLNGGSFNNAARFTGIAINDAAVNVTISGIRANVNPAYVPLGSGGFGQVLTLISVSNGVLPIQQVNNGFLVGIVLPGLGAISPTGSGITVQSCEGGVPLPTPPITGTFGVNVPENFPTAFKVQGPVALPSPDSETGPVTGAPIATSGTQFAVTFANIPDGITFAVPLTISAGTTGSAVLVAGEGSISPVASNTTVTLDTGSTVDAWSVTAGTTLFYNVTTASATVQETYVIPVYATGTVSATTGSPTVTVELASRGPVVDPSVNTAGATVVPLFASIGTNGSDLPTITVTPCQTTLLYPFMTNQAGFDTGFSIAATNTDPFGTFAQGGTCTVYLYGDTAPTTPPELTVPTGGEGHALISGIAPGFQGYGIAVCDFQYAHGFAFITDGFGGPGRGLAEGYLATVIGNTRGGTPSTSVNGVAGGESLGH